MSKRAWVAWTVGVLALLTASVSAAPPPDAKYNGSRMCIACHRRTQKDIVDRYVVSPMARSLTEVSDDNEDLLAELMKADFSTAPFKQEDVAWVLASGVHQQAYLDKDFKVLPAKWQVAEKTWVETPAVDAVTECLPCHTTNLDTEARTFKVAGVGCESCHGPGSAHMTAVGDEKKMETITRPQHIDAKVAAGICGQCHSKGRSTDGTSPAPKGYRPEANLDEYFKHDELTGPGLNQQYTDLIKTKHWEQDVTCLTCHDPHGETGHPAQLRKEITETCMDCHKDQVVDIPTHAQAKNVAVSEGATCATCHMPQGRHLFDKTVADSVVAGDGAAAQPVQTAPQPPAP